MDNVTVSISDIVYLMQQYWIPIISVVAFGIMVHLRNKDKITKTVYGFLICYPINVILMCSILYIAKNYWKNDLSKDAESLAAIIVLSFITSPLAFIISGFVLGMMLITITIHWTSQYLSTWLVS